MATHVFSFYDPPNCPLYQSIINGTKTVEGRKNSPQYQHVRPGDTIMFDYKKRGILVCKVTYVHQYDDIMEYLKNETLEKTMVCVTSIDDGIKLYEKYVPADEIKQLKDKYGAGFLAFGISFQYERKRYEIHVSEPWFTSIKNKTKKYEGRLNTLLFAKFKTNDILTIFNKQLKQHFDVTITEIFHFDTFRQMLNDLGVENVLPGIKSVDEGVMVYRQWYNEDKEKQFRVLAIKVAPFPLSGGFYDKYMKYKTKYINLKFGLKTND
jgi:ASC-1-like (ASCH) protein